MMTLLSYQELQLVVIELRRSRLNKYDVAYLKMAEAFSETSVANRLKVGCVIVRDGQPIWLSINGTEKGGCTDNCDA